MKAITIKLPAGLAAWLERESARLNRSKSELVRLALQKQQLSKGQTVLELAGDLCGSVDSRKGDLSFNKKRLKGFGR